MKVVKKVEIPTKPNFPIEKKEHLELIDKLLHDWLGTLIYKGIDLKDLEEVRLLTRLKEIFSKDKDKKSGDVRLTAYNDDELLDTIGFDRTGF